MSDPPQSAESLLNELQALRAQLADCERDRGEREKTEEALRQSEDRYRQMFERNQATKLLIDPKTGALIDANSAAARFYGYPLEQLKRMNIRDLNTLPAAEVQDAIDRAVREKQCHFQFPHRLASGEIRIVEVFTGLIQVGNCEFLYSIVHDVTERIQTENELRENENRLRLILEQTPAIHWTTDRDLRFTSAAGAGLAALGLLPNQNLGQTVEEYFQTVDPDFPPIASHRRALQGESVAYETQWSGRAYQTHLEPLRDPEGIITGTIGIALDITERKQAEEERLRLESQIQHAQKLESLGILAGGIAHDFNNLLTGIMGNASLAALDLAKDSPVRYSIQQIEVAAQRAAELTRQMLAYSGRGRFVIQPVSLTTVIQEMTSLLQSAVSKKAVLHFEFEDNLTLIEADVGQIKQVVMNLISNASDALGEQTGVIKIRTGLMQLDSRVKEEAVIRDGLSDGDYAFLEVVDTGCGMGQATKARIFDPFFSTKFTGRGLGLAAVLGIVRGHKGTIRLSTAPGLGTSVQVMFPCLSSGGAGQPEMSKESSTRQGQGTILVVDDEDGVRSLAKTILERAGFQVVLAVNGRAGIDLFRQSPDHFDAVLLDLTMPEKNGEEVIDEINRIRPGARIILMSGYSVQEVSTRFVAKGLAGFLQKPFRPDEVLEVLDQALKTDG
jgi:PAS domain S-box-containing protein